MGILGEEEEDHLNEMVRHYIEYGSSSSSSSSISKSSSSTSISSFNNSFLLNLQGILGTEYLNEEAVIQEKISMYLRNMGIKEEQAKGFKKFIVDKLKMEGYQASLCKNSWTSTLECFKVSRLAGRYEYIDIILEDHESRGSSRLIVDMDFNSQFELARPTEIYKELINMLPIIFIGGEEKLNDVVSLLCAAAKHSLKQNSLHVPPWREPNYMESKWHSKYCNRIDLVSPNKTNPRREVSTFTLQKTCVYYRGFE